MRLWSVFRKSMREQTRDLLVLSLSLVFAPFFVFLYWLFFPSGSTTYGVMILNNDVSLQLSDGATFSASVEMIEALKEVTYANGQPFLEVEPVSDREGAEQRLKDRDAALLLIIPADFSHTIYSAHQGQEPEAAAVTFIGDLTNPYYAVAAVMAGAGLDQYVQMVTNEQRPILVEEIALGASAARTEFEVYVPGLLVFAVVMLIFQASMVIAQEVESGTLRRLQITRMTAFDLLGGVSATLVLFGALAVVLTFLAAWGLGFRSQGPIWVAVLIGVLTSFSVIGAGLVVAAFSKTVNQAFLIANFPLVFFMFFSSAIFPIPRVPLFEIAGRTIGLFDVLPPTHAVVALNKVLTLGAGIGDVAYELAALIILSAAYFAAGVWLFQRNHLRAS